MFQPEVQTAIEEAKIEQALGMSVREKFLAGPELFDLACTLARVGIGSQLKDASAAEKEAELDFRLSLMSA